MLHQDDKMMRQILSAVGVSNPGIQLMERIRERNAVHPYEVTDERRRLDFLKLLVDRCAIGRGDRYPSLEGIKDVGWVPFIGDAAQRRPEIASNPSGYPAEIDAMPVRNEEGTLDFGGQPAPPPGPDDGEPRW